MRHVLKKTISTVIIMAITLSMGLTALAAEGGSDRETAPAPVAVSVSSGGGFASSSAFSSSGSFSSAGPEESMIENAIKHGYAQEVGKVLSNEYVELRVKGVVYDKGSIYAEMGIKMLDGTPVEKIQPMFTVDTGEKNNAVRPGLSFGKIALLSLRPTLETSAATSMSMTMHHEEGSDGYADLSIKAEVNPPASGKAYLKLSGIRIDQSTEYEYTAAEWLKNPVDGINVTNIEFSENEMFMCYESGSAQLNPLAEGADSLPVYPRASGSQSNDDETRESYAYWDFEGYERSADSFIMSEKSYHPSSDTVIIAKVYGEPTTIECNLPIEVSIDENDALKPLYEKNVDIKMPSANGEVRITSVSISPIFSSISFETVSDKKQINTDPHPVTIVEQIKAASFPAVAIMEQTTTAASATTMPAPPEAASMPRDLKTFRERMDKEANETFTPAVYSEPYTSREIIKVEINGNICNPSSGSYHGGPDGVVLQNYRYPGVEDLSKIKISVLQEDGSYKEVTLP